MHFYDATLINRGKQVITKLSELRKPGRKRRAGVKAVMAMLKRTGL
ncbi:MAG: hypothetical protein ACYCZR_01145 [Burkholderiales bacterium]